MHDCAGFIARMKRAGAGCDCWKPGTVNGRREDHALCCVRWSTKRRRSEQLADAADELLVPGGRGRWRCGCRHNAAGWRVVRAAIIPADASASRPPHPPASPVGANGWPLRAPIPITRGSGRYVFPLLLHHRCRPGQYCSLNGAWLLIQRQAATDERGVNTELSAFIIKVPPQIRRGQPPPTPRRRCCVPSHDRMAIGRAAATEQATASRNADLSSAFGAAILFILQIPGYQVTEQ